ncbi:MULTISPECIES: ribonuclease P protein component [Holzapfeliella]
MRKKYRIKKEQEFQTVYQGKNSCANRAFVIYQMSKPNQKHFRVGISVGKKVGHHAVVRNRLKRYIRQTLTEELQDLPKELDFLVIARPYIRDFTMAEVRQNLRHALKVAKILEK